MDFILFPPCVHDETGMAYSKSPTLGGPYEFVLEFADDMTWFGFDAEMRICRLIQIRRINKSITQTARTVGGIDRNADVRADMTSQTAGRSGLIRLMNGVAADQ